VLPPSMVLIFDLDIGVWTVWYVCFSLYYSGNWCVDSVVCVFFIVL
jgi:hypothetical protein